MFPTKHRVVMEILVSGHDKNGVRATRRYSFTMDNMDNDSIDTILEDAVYAIIDKQ